MFSSKGSTFCRFDLGSSTIEAKLSNETFDETVANSDKFMSDSRPPSIPWNAVDSPYASMMGREFLEGRRVSGGPPPVFEINFLQCSNLLLLGCISYCNWPLESSLGIISGKSIPNSIMVTRSDY
uniref:Uncharacterized protein n=1 Tax=Romanomermis culicivorax TaxID=13658 RepID=A0A915J904_ROMCU